MIKGCYRAENFSWCFGSYYIHRGGMGQAFSIFEWGSLGDL
jgi:hypothetical protein